MLRWEYVIENEFINYYNEAVHHYHEKMKSFVDEDRMPNTLEIKHFVQKLRDEILEIFDESLKLKTKATEKKFREYKNKLIEFMNQKEEIALHLNGNEENSE